MLTTRLTAIAFLVAGAIPSAAGTLTPNTGPAEIAPADIAPTGIAPAGIPPAATAGSPATQAFKAADDRMMRKMGAPLSGDPDRDFVTNMLPHHEGAVDMANIELRYGKDPELRRLAAAIVKAQDKEIAEMRAWRAKHP